MAYTKNNITFNSFDGNSFARGKKVSQSQYLGANIDELSDIASDNGGNLPTIINALEIDWNTAVLPNGDPSTGGNKTIKTTDELLKQIDDMQKEIYVLTAAVIALASN